MLRFFRRPTRAKISYNQKLLLMHRELLAEYLRQEKLWDITDVPEFLSTGISLIRDEIRHIKDKLRNWEVTVIDFPDDDGPVNELARKVHHQQELLEIHRTTLHHYLKQLERVGVQQVDPTIIQSIGHTRKEIANIKAVLRGWDVSVEDLPEDQTS